MIVFQVKSQSHRHSGRSPRSAFRCSALRSLPCLWWVTPRVLLRLGKMGQADGRTPDRYITLATIDATSIITELSWVPYYNQRLSSQSTRNSDLVSLNRCISLSLPWLRRRRHQRSICRGSHSRRFDNSCHIINIQRLNCSRRSDASPPSKKVCHSQQLAFLRHQATRVIASLTISQHSQECKNQRRHCFVPCDLDPKTNVFPRLTVEHFLYQVWWFQLHRFLRYRAEA